MKLRKIKSNTDVELAQKARRLVSRSSLYLITVYQNNERHFSNEFCEHEHYS